MTTQPTLRVSWLAATLVLAVPLVARAAKTVELELITDPGFPLGGERRWIEVLQELPDVRIRIRSGRDGDRPEVRDEGPRGLHVVGILTSQNRLRVPGATFGLGDGRAIGQWLDRLRAEGAEALNAPRGAFGMTAAQLAELHESLQAKVGKTTKDLPLLRFLELVRGQLKTPLEVEAAAARELAALRVQDELETFSLGTAMAIALRAHGYVLAVERRQGTTVLRVTRGDQAKEYWPIGYSIEGSPQKAVPNLFKFLEVEINDTPLADALAAIESRLERPILLDRNALARQDIDPAEVKVNYPAGRTYYKKILDKLLFQARLRFDIRADEAGTVFLWVAPSRT